MNERTYYIYSHSDSAGVIRYIGQGIKYLTKSGVSNYVRSRSKKGRNDDWWIVFPNGIPNKIEIIEDDISQEDINQVENKWILHYGMERDGGTLVNRQLNDTLMFMTDEERKAYKYETHKKWAQNNKEHLRKLENEYWSRPENIDRRKEIQKRTYEKNKEKRALHSKKRYDEIKDKIEYKEYRKEYIKKYESIEENKLKHKQRGKEWYERNKERIKDRRKENGKKWAQNNKERLREIGKEWYERNKEKVKARRKELYQLKKGGQK